MCISVKNKPGKFKLAFSNAFPHFKQQDVEEDALYSDIEFIKLFKQFNKENLEVIGEMISAGQNGTGTTHSEKSQTSEEFVSSLKMLKKKLIKYKKYNGSNVILFNSPDENEFSAKSMLGFTNLVTESNNQKLLIIDCNLRTPKIPNILNVKYKYGLSDYCRGNKTLSDITNKTEWSNVSLITSNGLDANPTQLLMSDRFIGLISYVKSNYDFVLIDSPPFRNYVDTFILSKYLTPIVLLVIKGEKNAWKKVKEIRNELSVLGVRILGLIDKTA